MILYESLDSFKAAVIPFLEEDEAENSLILGLLMNAGSETIPYLMALAREDGQPAAVLFQTIRRQIVMSKPRGLNAEKFVSVLMEKVKEIPGLVGEKEFTLKLSEKIAAAYGTDVKIRMNQRLYKMTEAKIVPSEKGRLVKADRRDLDMITDWMYQFGKETGDPLDRSEAEEKSREFLRRQSLYGWEAGGRLVSIANAARPTRRNITVNFVYTPKDERKQGYATDCVAALSRLLLNRGYQSLTLYTDLDNPTSNKIYTNIGYEPVMDAVVISF
nr:GNAT family N-acetyltransferase [Metabacillus kandeliae]